MTIRRSIALLTVVLSASVPAAAQAQSTQARPGNAGIDEYQEAIPDSKGSGPAGGTGLAPKLTPGADRVIPKRTLSTLASKGDDGRAAAALAEATSPKGGSKPAAPSQFAPPPAAADGNGLDAIGRVLASDPGNGLDAIGRVLASDPGNGLDAIGRVLASDPGDGGIGLLLPIGMLLVLTAAIGAVILRRRRAGA